MAEQLWQALQGLPSWLVVVILSAAPISEVRGGIPVGIAAYHMPLWQVLPLAVAANVLAVLWVVPTFNWITARCAGKPVAGPVCDWLVRRAEKRRPVVEKYGVFAVTLFVAIPLPITGAWTGSIVASVFRLPFAKASLCLLLGVLIASAIMTALTLGGVQLFSAIHVTE